MKKLYDKSEIWFAVIMILIYVFASTPVRGNFGDESPVMTAVLAAISVLLFVFIKKNHLEERYGFVKWKGSAKDYLYFIPMLIIMTGNIWGGVGVAYSGAAQVFAVFSMMLVGFVEEVIFRGLLFRAMLKKDPPAVSIAVSAVTFGIGHIVNLFAGQANLETVIQILFAVAWGFIFTFAFYKSGCLWINIIVHGIVDVLSKFSAAESNIVMTYIYVGTTIVIAIAYSVYLSRKPTALTEAQE